MMKNPVKITECSWCKNRMELFHKHRLLYNNIFCSKECEKNFKKSKPNVKCKVCGKDFHLKPSVLKKIKTYPCCSIKCSSELKKSSYLGKNNSNYKYEKNLDLIYNLTPDGAYILGLIWSDGSLSKNTITISQKGWEECPLVEISEIIFGKDTVKKTVKNYVLSITEKELVDYIVSLGGIKRGKKSYMIEMPNISEDMIWPFLCGYFDGDGGFKYNYKYPEISLTSNSYRMLEQVSQYWNVNYNGKDNIYASGMKALEICGKMYESCNLHNKRKYYYYLDILNWEPGIENRGRWMSTDKCKYKKLSIDALPPEKKRVTDSGNDVYAIEFKPLNENIGTYIADMRIAVQPPPGFYFELVGRSSLPINNLHFLGGVGIIDQTYVGSLKMILQKIDMNKPLPETPFKCGQLILKKFLHVPFVRVDDIQDTERGKDGFGSTGKK